MVLVETINLVCYTCTQLYNILIYTYIIINTQNSSFLYSFVSRKIVLRFVKRASYGGVGNCSSSQLAKTSKQSHESGRINSGNNRFSSKGRQC